MTDICLLYSSWDDRYSYRTGNPCSDGRNMGKSAKLPLCSIRTKGNGVTPFTELHRTLHKNFLIWRCQMVPPALFDMAEQKRAG